MRPWVIFIFPYICLCIINWCYVRALVKFTNIECKAFDKPFADFKNCRLRVPKRGTIAMSVHVKLYKVPVNNVSINLSLLKKANGYHPFLYNMSVNFCEFMANRKRFPFIKLVFDALLKDSNINHTCPYDHDIIVDNFVIEEHMLVRLPLPDGEYLFKLLVGAYNVWKADVRVYLVRKEENSKRFGLL